MAGDDDPEQVIKVTEDFGDRYVEVTAYRVPVSDRYPEGVKYSMQYGNAAGETIIRYDNFPDHPDVADHHKHCEDGTVEPVSFEGLQALYKRFKIEVNHHGHDW